METVPTAPPAEPEPAFWRSQNGGRVFVMLLPAIGIALRGNGNHCDYRARFTLSTSLTGPELTAYYDKAKIEGVEGGRPSITVWMPEPSKRSAYTFGGFSADVAIVELYDGTPAGFDLRCR
ncbi:hypothetical protein [Nonomuraea pusilla]|uniref:Uncharacterized protein n=1 Tax=Nonomuraea pusilla TaxID=46177 RepID=A0A1H8EXU3_9ACTN|nr:hypothetical protein [Nonomuraea pusilla]SEN23568.1 hypothetical protein SAMN05660976_07126 [Nonomuraea pusilla]